MADPIARLDDVARELISVRADIESVLGQRDAALSQVAERDATIEELHAEIDRLKRAPTGPAEPVETKIIPRGWALGAVESVDQFNETLDEHGALVPRGLLYPSWKAASDRERLYSMIVNAAKGWDGVGAVKIPDKYGPGVTDLLNGMADPVRLLTDEADRYGRAMIGRTWVNIRNQLAKALA